MLLAYIEGLALSAAMIIAIGPQNAFVIAQGIKRQYSIMVASVCALSDALLITLGVFGGGALFSRSIVLLQLVTWAGVVFLLYYGWCAFRQLWQQNSGNFTQINAESSRWRTLLILLAVTWLNPHVYLDTVVIIGSASSQWPQLLLGWFTFGAVTASFVWFYSLALMASWFSPTLQKPRAQQVINLLIALIMWSIAIRLALGGYSQLIALLT